MSAETIKLSTDNAATIQFRPYATSSVTYYVLVYATVIDSQATVHQENDLRQSLLRESTQSESDAFLTMLASEALLSREWGSPEEDEAWNNL